MAGWLGGWVAGWPGGWVAGWPGGWLARWPGSLPASETRIIGSTQQMQSNNNFTQHEIFKMVGDSHPGGVISDGALVEDVFYVIFT